MAQVSEETGAVLEAADAFGLHEPRVLGGRLPEAWSNHVYAVECAEGRFAIKVFPADLDLARLRRGMSIEAAVLAAGEVPMPEPVSDSCSSWLVRVRGGRRARAHRWVDGIPGSAVQPTAQLMRDVGRSVGAVQSLSLPAGTTADLAPFRPARWQSALERVRRLQPPWAQEFEALTPLIGELAAEHAQLRAQRRPMFGGHGDLDPKNAVVRAGGRVSLTDWDSAGPILPAAELVIAATSFAAPAEPLVEEFAGAYLSRNGDVPAPDRLALAIPALQDIDWLIDIVDTLEPGRCSEPPQPLIGFAGGVEDGRSWARRIARLW